MDQCAWNEASYSCETDECSYYLDQASCPSSSYGSQCFWTLGSWSGNEICSSIDPCSRSGANDEYMCGNDNDECTWNDASWSCETDECSYYHDQASCPSSSYGSQCFWTWGSWSGDNICTSNDPCSNSYSGDDESSCEDSDLMSMDQCTWNDLDWFCETDECSYYHDQASCPSSSYGSQCFWTYGSWSGMDICTSNDPCSSGDEWSCEDSSSMSTDQCAWNGASCETSECSYASDEATCTGNGCYWVWGFSGDEVCRSWE